MINRLLNNARPKPLGIIFLLGLVLSAPLLRSESLPQKEYGLQDLIQQTLAHSEWILSFNTRIEEKRFAAKQSRRFQNPEGSASVGQKEVSSISGPLLEFSLTQPFLFPGKRELRAGIADSDTEMAKINKSKAEIVLIIDVTRVVYEHAINHQKSEFAHKRQERFELIKSYLAGRAFATPQKKAERNIVESRLRKIIAENLEIETSLKDSLEKIRLYTRLEDNDPKIQAPWLKGTTDLDENQWQTKVLGNNPDLAAQRLLVNRTGQELSLARKERWSDFSVSAFYGEESAGETERRLGAGIALPLPLLNLNTGNIKSLIRKYEAEKFLLSFQERELSVRLRQAVNEFEAARKSVLLYPQPLFSNLKEQIRESEEAFRKGQLDLLLFLEVDEQTEETYYRALDAQLGLVDKLSNLYLLAGEKELYVQLDKF